MSFLYFKISLVKLLNLKFFKTVKTAVNYKSQISHPTVDAEIVNTQKGPLANLFLFHVRQVANLTCSIPSHPSQ